jgi:hypothetical protein
MVSKKPAEPSPESVARANRQRLAREEGVLAMEAVEQKAVAIRKNMERLRALREAKEAQDMSAQAGLSAVPKKKRKTSLSK